MDSKTIGHKLRALRGEMDAKPLLMRLESVLRRFLCMSVANVFPAIRSRSASPSTSARVSKKFFSQSEYILCSFQRR